MSEQENKKIVQAVFESFGRGDISALLANVADDVVWNAPGSSSVPHHGERRGHEGVKDFFGQLGSNIAFESFELGELIAEGDKVVTRWTARGTHQGELMGVAPSGNRAEVSGMTINRVSGGKIAETWTNFDALGLMQQIGAIPEPGQEEEATAAEQEEKGLMDKAKEKLTGQ